MPLTQPPPPFAAPSKGFPGVFRGPPEPSRRLEGPSGASRGLRGLSRGLQGLQGLQGPFHGPSRTLQGLHTPPKKLWRPPQRPLAWGLVGVGAEKGIGYLWCNHSMFPFQGGLPRAYCGTPPNPKMNLRFKEFLKIWALPWVILNFPAYLRGSKGPIRLDFLVLLLCCVVTTNPSFELLLGRVSSKMILNKI